MGLFFIGWVLPFIGRYFEGRKTIFVDDLAGLQVGFIFVVCEVSAGLLQSVCMDIERHTQTTH